MASGSTTTCTGLVSSLTKMGTSTTGSLSMARRTAMELICGQMAASSRAGGTKASSTASALTLTQMRGKKFGLWEDGKRVKVVRCG